jgi:hypothetical protein
MPVLLCKIDAVYWDATQCILVLDVYELFGRTSCHHIQGGRVHAKKATGKKIYPSRKISLMLSWFNRRL